MKLLMMEYVVVVLGAAEIGDQRAKEKATFLPPLSFLSSFLLSSWPAAIFLS
jgi:hypothetical protein